MYNSGMKPNRHTHRPHKFIVDDLREGRRLRSKTWDGRIRSADQIRRMYKKQIRQSLDGHRDSLDIG